MDQTSKIRWGIIGPGVIAKTFSGGLKNSQTGELVAIATRNADRPGLSDDFPGARIHSGYHAILSDSEVDAIYIATPHVSHAEWAIKCAEAGKHVLCEKPIALTAADAEKIFDAARKFGTFMGEAFMYRLHPQTAKLLELIKSGIIGEVRMIKSAFGFAMDKFDPTHRIYANELAGGGILDVGCYPVSMSRLIAGTVAGKPFEEPTKVHGVAHLGETGVDEWAAAVMQFPNSIIAEVACSISLSQDNVLRILGTEGRIEVADFWFASGHEGGIGEILVTKKDMTVDIVEVEEPGWLYAFEADAAGEAIRAGKQQFDAPGMSWDDTLGNMRVLDKWRADAGLVYKIEQ